MPCLPLVLVPPAPFTCKCKLSIVTLGEATTKILSQAPIIFKIGRGLGKPPLPSKVTGLFMRIFALIKYVPAHKCTVPPGKTAAIAAEIVALAFAQSAPELASLSVGET